jgi:hypothetical protein
MGTTNTAGGPVSRKGAPKSRLAKSWYMVKKVARSAVTQRAGWVRYPASYAKAVSGWKFGFPLSRPSTLELCVS